MSSGKKKREIIMKTSKIILIFSLLISLFFLGVLTGSKNARAGANDIEFEFENDYLYNGDLISTESQFNTRNQTAITSQFNGTDSFDYNMAEGVYYGTYDFRDEVDETGEDIDWLDHCSVLNSDQYCEVDANIYGHDTAVLLKDYNTDQELNMYDIVSGTGTSGYVEFWMLQPSITLNTEWTSIEFYEGTDKMTRIWFYYDDIGIYNGTVSSSYTGHILPNVWYHIKVGFNSTHNWLYFNGELVIEPMKHNYDRVISTSLTKIGVYFASAGQQAVYLDAIGYSWDLTSHNGLGYEVGYNINPYDIGPLLNAGYSIDLGYDSTINVVNLENHYDVLEIDSKDCSVQTIISDSLDNIPSGTIEFWFAVNETNEATWRIVQIREFPYIIMTIVIVNNDIALYDGATLTYYNNFIIANSWNHVKLTFDISTQDCNLYVNGLLRVESIGFQDTLQEGIDVFRVVIGANTDTKFYLDALGYSWDANYAIGENMFPYQERERIGYVPTNHYSWEEGEDYGIWTSGNVSDLWEIDGECLNYTHTDQGDVGILFDFTDYAGLNAYLDIYATHNETRQDQELFDWWIGLYHSRYSSTGSIEVFSVDNTEEPLNETGIYIGNLAGFSFLGVWAESLGWPVNLSIDMLRIYTLPFNRTEFDRFEFISNSTGDFYPIGIDPVIEHVDQIKDSYDSFYLWNDEGIDNYLAFYPVQDYSQMAINRSFDVYDEDDFLEFSIGFIATSKILRDFFEFNISDINGDDLFKFRLMITPWEINSSYYDETQSKWVELTYNKFSETNDYELRGNVTILSHGGMLYITYLDSLGCEFNLIDHGDVLRSFYVRLYNEYPYHREGGSSGIGIDYYSLYVNGDSISDESVPNNIFVLSGDNWYFNEYNFIKIEFDGDFENNVSIVFNGQLDSVEYNDYSDYFANHYHETKMFSGCYFEVFNASSNFAIESVQIYGIKMIASDTSQKYKAIYDFNNVNPNNSYFYASNSRLYYQITANEQSVLEYMSVSFYPFEVYGLDYGISFKSNMNGYFLSYFSIDFLYTATLTMQFDDSGDSHAFELSNDEIDFFEVLVTDNNLLWNQNSTGYIYDIELFYIPDLEFSFTISALIELLIPLLVLIIVPFGFSIKLGKSVIVPMMIFIGFILAITGLMPNWIFFLIITGAFVYYLAQKKRGDA